jgi:DNA-binding NarL/FixJ family response regulator
MTSAPKSAPASRPKLLLVDDHTIVREGLKRILENTHDGWSLTEESSGFQALERLRHSKFDIAIVDLSMPGMSGLELIRRIRADDPHLPVLVLSMHAEEEYALRAFKIGANGYITKDSPAEELIKAVRKVLSGGAYVTASLAERVVQQLNGTVDVPRHTLLSDRELEVLRHICAGRRSSEIAEALHLSVKTVSTHKTRILDKLQLGSTAALIRYGMQHGLTAEDAPGNLQALDSWDTTTGPGLLD